MSKKTKVDMSAEAVTARLKQAFRLGEVELSLKKALTVAAEIRLVSAVLDDKSAHKEKNLK